MKASSQSTELHVIRLKDEYKAEIQRLTNEIAAKNQALKLLEDSLNEREFDDEQKKLLQKAAAFEQIQEELRRVQGQLRAKQEQIHQLEMALSQAEFMKSDYEKAKAEVERVSVQI